MTLRNWTMHRLEINGKWLAYDICNHIPHHDSSHLRNASRLKRRANTSTYDNDIRKR
jgi:hypothetical protein